MTVEATPGYLRLRVVNPRVTTIWNENFESLLPSGAVGTTLWHSLGTEAGTDNSISYWTQVAGVWTYASHILTAPATNAALITAGNRDWGDMSFQVRFQWATGVNIDFVIHCDGTDSNWVGGFLNSATLNLQKRIAGTSSNVATNAQVPVNGTFYWMQIFCSGTSYQVNWYNDSAGARGTLIASVSGTVSDAGVQHGYCGVRNSAAVGLSIGGAFANVCAVSANNGAAPNFWVPSVTTGEPAFCLDSVTAQAGTYSASIEIVGSTSGNGAWTQPTTLPVQPALTQSLLQGQIKAATGTANISAGGLTTGNGTSSFANQTATGQMTANPTVSCNYSGAIGIAYFDALSIISQGTELTSDLPHIGPCQWSIRAFQPGNPSSSALGSFSIPLHPPDTEGFAAAKVIYDQLDYFQRIEAYVGTDAGAVTLGKLVFTGIVDEISKNRGPKGNSFELRGKSDLILANLARPFPGDFLSNDVTSAMVKSYMGVNELAWGDTFGPFTAANYTSTFLPGATAGTWSSTTDDGFNVVSCSAGTTAALIAKTGAVCNDRWHTQFVEVTGRLAPSADGANAGQVGLGLSQANSNGNNAILAFVTAQKQNGRYQLVCGIQSYSAGSVLKQFVSPSILYNVDDPNTKIPFTIGLLVTNGGNSNGTSNATLVVNGKVVLGQFATGIDLGTTSTWYPFLEFQVPASGSATAYYTNFLQFNRFTPDGPSTAAAFTSGTITTSSNSLGYGVDPGPSHLEAMQRLATREGNYLRYNPQAYVVGTRTLGTVDSTAAPGTDRSNSIFFNVRDGSLAGIGFSGNADSLVGDTATTGQSTLDGGGIGFWRDLSSIQKYGLLQDESLAFTQADFNSLRRAAMSISKNKVNVGTAGAKTATVIRDPSYNEVWRELDNVTVNDPEMGLNNLKVLILGYDFNEGSGTEDLILDQFGLENQLF